jgi:CelD/BcsL family acetyltransferase involved in cellulose biosynthesis
MHGEIEAGHLHDIVRLANQRMLSKGCPPYIDDSHVPALVHLAQTHGNVGLILIDGRVVAGTLSFYVGKRWFSHLVAHDPELNAYGLGNQVQLQVILRAIGMGAREFWMMGGGSEVKARFLTQRTMLNSITVFRSSGAAIRSWRRFAANDIKKNIFGFKEAVRNASTGDSFWGRSAARLLKLGRAIKSANRATNG